MPSPLTDEPRDLLLDSSNDLVIENGDFVFARGIDAVAQSCRIALQMFEGEWFLDQSVGIPYWQQILGFKPAIAMRAAHVGVACGQRCVGRRSDGHHIRQRSAFDECDMAGAHRSW
jgi:hypothetical protein